MAAITFCDVQCFFIVYYKSKVCYIVVPITFLLCCQFIKLDNLDKQGGKTLFCLLVYHTD